MSEFSVNDEAACEIARDPDQIRRRTLYELNRIRCLENHFLGHIFRIQIEQLILADTRMSAAKQSAAAFNKLHGIRYVLLQNLPLLCLKIIDFNRIGCVDATAGDLAVYNQFFIGVKALFIIELTVQNHIADNALKGAFPDNLSRIDVIYEEIRILPETPD